MLTFHPRDWRIMGIRGLVAVAFGILTLAAPRISLSALIVFFAVFVMVDGVFTVVTAIRSRKNHAYWGNALFKGVLAIVLAILVVAWPDVTAVVLLYFIAIWLMLLGLSETFGALRLRKEIEGETWLVVAGLVTFAIGLLLALRPSAGVAALGWLIGIGALVIGLTMVFHAWRIRRTMSSTL